MPPFEHPGTSTSPQADASPLLRRLRATLHLTEREIDAVLALPVQAAEIERHVDIVREGDRPTRSFALLEGFACTFKFTGDGRRQIIAVHVPGDIPDLQSLHLTTMDVSVGTLSPCKVGFIQHDALRVLCEQHPRITGALWRETLIAAAISREWVLNLGQRQAPSRMAHLICEMIVRLWVVGLAADLRCEFPVNQGELADAIGVSPVHVNRVTQDLRAQNLFEWKGRHLRVLNWARLVQVADFDPTYLHVPADFLPGDGNVVYPGAFGRGA